MGRLSGRNILITGAASGIGRAIALRFHAEGARLALLDRDGAGLADVSSVVAGATYTVDLIDCEATEQAVSASATALDGLDGVVNAAGLHIREKLADADLQSWHKMLAINLTAPMVVCKASLKWLGRRAGSTIVNIASGSALYPVPERSGYAASKGGLISLTKSLALELAPSIRVNALCPGSIDTPMLREGMKGQPLESLKSVYALGRVGEPGEIADAALYLTSSESSFVTGVALAVDGGRTFH
jgi:NAD(P)-dependent dehydrogenase (short-subunit alcohol dehydrogenase family)